MTTFQKLTKVCAAYSVDSLAHTRDSVENNVCAPYPSEPSSSNRQWYYLNAVPNATTTACKDIKDAKPSSEYKRAFLDDDFLKSFLLVPRTTD